MPYSHFSRSPSVQTVTTAARLPNWTTADIATLDDAEQVALMRLAEQVLDDPIALQSLSDRVFELLQQQVRLQCQQHDPYRRYSR